MSKRNSSIKPGLCVIILIGFVFCFNNKFYADAKRLNAVKTKGTVKTIKREDGDIIDCVDIYKQPAFDHPLLQNHTIQDVNIKPYAYYNESADMDCHPNISQVHPARQLCPNGTIPIRRSTNLEDYYKKSYPSRRRYEKPTDVHEYATVSTQRASYYGAHARLNVWNPQLELPTEFSLAQIWVSTDVGGDANFESIEVGWMVNPILYGDTQTRFFLYWTKDDYAHGCYNLDCPTPGFVQTHPTIVMGGTLSPISEYGGNQFELTVDIQQDVSTGNWIVLLNGEILGYWPGSLFTYLVNSANIVDWGGEIADDNTERHTTTTMGSGHFAVEGYQKASFIRELRVQDSPQNWIVPSPLRPKVRTPNCYSFQLTQGDESFYYGGPGYSPTMCP